MIKLAYPKKRWQREEAEQKAGSVVFLQVQPGAYPVTF
jgi:hypothetical protein